MNPTANVFSPGCAMFLYKPELAGKLWSALKLEPGFDGVPLYKTCCRGRYRHRYPA